MKTEIYTIDYDYPDMSIIQKAADMIRNGGLVAFPTETVYGLGADAFNRMALKRIYEAKGRPGDNPLIIHISEWHQLSDIAEQPGEYALKAMEAFWPGPLTVILNKKNNVPDEATGGLDTVAVRMPSHSTARLLINESGRLIAAPSANSSGRPSPTRASHVVHDLDRKIDIILDGGDASYGLESTVVDLSGSTPVLLRPGGITREMLEIEIGPLDLDPSVIDKPSGDAAPRSPGMKYTHYSPIAKVIVVTGELKRIVGTIDALARTSRKKTGILATEQTKSMYTADALILSAGDRDKPYTIAYGLFDKLRQFDIGGVEVVYSEGFPTDGIGLAIMNRLQKAAGYEIINVD